MNLTKYYPARIKPIRNGVYERKINGSVKYAYWNGNHWCAYAWNVKQALNYLKVKSSFQVIGPWRGLASNPE